EMFEAYQKLCENKQFKVGELWLYKTPNKWILNFPTKKHWKSPSQLDYIETGLKNFAKTYQEKDIFSIAFPPLGCGNGNLDWKDVKPLMEKYLNPLQIDVYVYLTSSQENEKEHLNIKEMKNWLRKQPKFLAFDEFWEDLQAKVNSQKKFGAVVAEIRNEALEVKNESLQANFYEEDLLDFWQNFRQRGYFFKEKKFFPSNFHKNFDLIFPVLNSLDYVNEIKLEGFGMGLQLKAKEFYEPKNNQIGLF
ncbi:macro domain-containing protein, partial [bacterium]|nr:macro domain-containing protein [bacterium]